MVSPNSGLRWMEYTVAETANYSKTAQGPCWNSLRSQQPCIPSSAIPSWATPSLVRTINLSGSVVEHKLPELPYARNSLAPHISAETLEYHYGKHHATYVA